MRDFELPQNPDSSEKPELSFSAYTDVLEMIEAESTDDASIIAMLEELIANEPIPDPNDPEAVEVFNKKMRLIQMRANEILARSDLMKTLQENIKSKIKDSNTDQE